MCFKVDDVVRTKAASGWFRIVDIDEMGRYATLQLLSYSNDETLYKGGFLKWAGLDGLTKITKEEALAILEYKKESLAAFEKLVKEAF